jgi:hypothetical protein
MELLEIAKEVLINQELENTHIYKIIKTGSQLFRDNPHDLDFIVLCDEIPNGRIRKHYEHDNETYDMIFLTLDYLEKAYKFEVYDGIQLFNYLLVKPLIETVYDTNEVEFPYFNMFSSGIKEKYIEVLYNYLTNTIHRAVFHLELMNKGFAYLYTAYMMYELETENLPQDIKDNINKIYNKLDDYVELNRYVEAKIIEEYNNLNNKYV